MADFELTAPPSKSTRRPLPLEHDPRQGSLFPMQRTLPPAKLRPTVKQAEGKTELEGKRTSGVQAFLESVAQAKGTVVAWGRVEATCQVCGDPLPAKATCCPNCYTKRGTPNASF